MNNLKKTKKRKGFTILELLVVIAIFGILSSIVMTYLFSSKETARDSRISINIIKIDSVAEMINTIYGEYDLLCDSSTSLSDKRGLDIIQDDVIENGGAISCYAVGNSYCISAELNSGEFFCIKNNKSPDRASSGCVNATTGCD